MAVVFGVGAVVDAGAGVPAAAGAPELCGTAATVGAKLLEAEAALSVAAAGAVPALALASSSSPLGASVTSLSLAAAAGSALARFSREVKGSAATRLPALPVALAVPEVLEAKDAATSAALCLASSAAEARAPVLCFSGEGFASLLTLTSFAAALCAAEVGASEVARAWSPLAEASCFCFVTGSRLSCDCFGFSEALDATGSPQADATSGFEATGAAQADARAGCLRASILATRAAAAVVALAPEARASGGALEGADAGGLQGLLSPGGRPGTCSLRRCEGLSSAGNGLGEGEFGE